MKIASKQIIVLSFILTGLFARQWVETGTSRPSEPVWDVNSISDRHLEISFDVGGYFIEQLPNGKNRITFPGSVPILESGAPELPRMARSIIIPDLAHMELSVLETEFIDVPVENIEPSKGNLTRDIDPSTIPYTYGKPYQTDEWYPSNFVFMREPYIMRSLRGQTVVLQPIQYNPIQRILRIYTHIKVSILENGLSQNNPLTRRPANGGSREFEHMYKDHFINYPTDDRYDVLGEQGPMLIISYGDFMDEMQTFVDWKNYKGIPTEMVDIADIGDVDDIAQLVEDQYYENGIAFVLLVGDIDQIETIRRSDGAGSNSPSDNSLTFVAGNDFYPDLIIGRFSAETGEQVETMINRTIGYEMDPDPAADWYKKGSGFASNQGPGDDGEYDDEHLDNIRELLLAYTYTEVDQIYDPDGTVAQGEAAINEGRSIVNYTGHGSNGSWGNGCPMNNTNVNGLVNTGMWPFIWSVACVNGEFNVGTCFAETWLRATDSDGNPTGAIATLMSTVNQAWNPPMDGQDEMNAIFVESYSDNIKRTFGGLSFNGMNQMNDSYGSQGYDETCYWTIFGDPSVVVRSDTPTGMEVTHSDVIIIGATEFNIETGESGALVSVSRDGDLLSSAYTDGSGAVNLYFETALDIPGPVDVVVTAYNRIPYETSINVIAPDGAYMLLGDVTVNSGGDQILDYGEMGYFYTTFENVGQDPSGDLTFILSHEGSMVNIITEEIFQSSVAAGDEVTVGPFELQVSWNVEDGAMVPFTIQAIDGAETWGYDVNMAVEAPAYNLVSAEFYDNGNGTLDPGESTILQLVIQNTGHAPVSYPTFEATTSDPYLTLGSIESDNAYWWDMDQQVTVTIEITASSDAPVGHTALAGLVIGALDTDYEFVYPVPVTFGLMIEDFETGNFASFDWVHGGNADWVIDSDAYSGSFSAKSGEIGHDQTSELSIVMNILYEGDIQFWSKASSEQGGSGTIYDYLDFYIDNDPQELMIGGTTDWVEYTVNLPAGEHTLRWVYQKDDAQSSGEDCAWVDRIYFPPGAIPPLNIDFGDLNFDSIVNVLDVIVTVNYIIGYIDLNNEQIQNADVNLDGSVDVFDILLIVDMALGN